MEKRATIHPASAVVLFSNTTAFSWSFRIRIHVYVTYTCLISTLCWMEMSSKQHDDGVEMFMNRLFQAEKAKKIFYFTTK